MKTRGPRTTKIKSRRNAKNRQKRLEKIIKLRGILKGEDESILRIVEEYKAQERAHEERLERLARPH